jgi:hypothetical protein
MVIGIGISKESCVITVDVHELTLLTDVAVIINTTVDYSLAYGSTRSHHYGIYTAQTVWNEAYGTGI